jgi:hypothetical protein
VYVAYTKDSHYISQLAQDTHEGQLILLEVWNLLTHSPLPYGITIFIREQSLRLRSFAHSRDRCPTVMTLSAISPSGSLGQSDERQNESATEGEKAAKRIRRVHRDPSRLLELVN